MVKAEAELFVEAKCIFGKPTDGGEARLRGVLDAINQMSSPNFFVDLHIDRMGSRASSTKGSKVDALDSIETKYAAHHATVTITGLDERSIGFHERLTGRFGA